MENLLNCTYRLTIGRLLSINVRTFLAFRITRFGLTGLYLNVLQGDPKKPLQKKVLYIPVFNTPNPSEH